MLPFRQIQDEDPTSVSVSDEIDPDIQAPPMQRPGVYNPDTQAALQPGESATTALGTQVEIGPDRSIFMQGAPRPAPTGAPMTVPPAGVPGVRPPIPGGQVDFSGIAARVRDLPLDQAQQAVTASIKFQGSRGYQNDLQAGMNPAQALAKWAPMLFYDRPQSMSGAVRQAINPMAPTSFTPANAQTGAPAYLQTGKGTVHIVPPTAQGSAAQPAVQEFGGQKFLAVPGKGGAVHYQPLRAPPKEGALSQIERDDLSFAEREIDKLQARQENDRMGSRAFEQPTADLTEGQKLESANYRDRQIKINALQRKIDSYHNRINKAVENQQPDVAPGAPAIVRPPSQPTGSTEAKPLPSSKADLVVGQTYRTRRGLARWDGQKFQPVDQ